MDGNRISTNLRNFIHILISTVALALPGTPSAIGGLMGEPSWTAESDDGRYQIVMLQLEPEWLDPNDVHDIELKRKFNRSGIYEGDKFLWPIPYHLPVYKVVVSPDGNHVLLAITDTDHTCSNIPPGAALYFYHKNKERDYWPDDEITWGYGLKLLIYKYLVPYPWNEWKETTYDPTAGTFTIATNQSEEFVFDIRTGKKIRTTSAWNMGIAVYLAIVPLLIYGSGRFGPKSNAVWGSKPWQVSIREMLLLTTVASMLLLLLRYSVVFSAATAVVSLVGGGIAQFRSRGRQSFWIGSVLAVYGTVIGLLVFGTLGEALLWRVSWLNDVLAVVLMLGGCAVTGTVVGALVGGAIADKRARLDTASDINLLPHSIPGA